MFRSIGSGVTKHPRIFVIGWLILAAVMASFMFYGWGHGGIFSRLATAEPDLPGSESMAVSDYTSSGTSDSTITIVIQGVDIEQGYPQAASVAQSERSLLSDVSGVDSVTDPFVFPDPTDQQAQALMSSEGDGFAVIVTLDEGISDDQIEDADQAINGLVQGDYLDAFHDDFPDATGYMVSSQQINDSITEVTEKDLIRGEGIGLPVALLLLVIVFGGFLAAGLPLVGAVVSILCGMGTLWLLTFAIDISSYILNIISLIGLALSIDYGLLVVSRYREEIATRLSNAGYDAKSGHLPPDHELEGTIHQAVVETVATAGRTVCFSALTIASSVAGLIVFTSPILKTIAYGGIIVTLLAVLTAITLVPSLITLLGPRLVRPSAVTRIPVLRSMTKAVGDSASDTGFFSRLSHRVVAHPWIIMILVSALLALMASPIGTLRLRSSFVEYLPEGSAVQTGYHLVQDNYPALATPSVIVVADAPMAETASLMQDIEDFDGVTYVMPSELADHEGMTQINVLVDADDQVGPEVTDIVEHLRDADPGYEIWVGGTAASQLDFNQSLFDGAPWAITVIVMAVLILLFLMTGSLIVPLKALIINSFSLIASLGATAWLFENGHFGLPQVHGLETFVVACMLAFGFGLAMDYEVFLLARIKEYWEAGHDNDEAVARGMQRSGRIITSAAAIIIMVFLGFVSGEMLAIKEIGVALAITVAADATLVRLLLVPATMTVLGKWNWWAPKPLRWVYSKIGIKE